ncbi:MAG: magnesium/cobalt transporter CorA [Acidobacteriota bacterium]|nr:magnesium/cobalt transporter CorA [Acidobacteriota bacterium]
MPNARPLTNGARRSRKKGLDPGSLVYVGEPKTGKPRITILDYDAENVLEKEACACEDCFAFRDTATVTWINVDGVHEPSIIETIGGHFGVHPLILEDILTTSQRPKMEDLGEMLYIVLRMLEYDETKGEVRTDQLSLILGRNFLISFQEEEGDMFDPIRDRIRKAKGRIRKLGPDYLAYALLDAVVDQYFVVLEKLGERIEALEEDLVNNPRKETLHEIHKLKREMIYVRKSVWPVREVVAGLERAESGLIQPATDIFLRDVYDHTVQVIDNVETFRDMISGMVETYLSSVSNRMNEIMKVLTIISTIFIPLTFIVGVYGMNFKHMPELEWKWGYFLIWGVIMAVALAMADFFRRKKWL